MTKNTLTKTTYKALLSDINSILTKGQEEAQAKINSILALTYWQVGKRIQEESLSQNANYHNSILSDLEEDLKIAKTTLTRAVQFYNLYPNKPEISNLTWSHYRQLITIKDDDQRQELENQVKEESWTLTKLDSTLKQIALNPSKQINNNTNPKKITRPTDPNYLYKAKIAQVVDGDTLILHIDLGFQVIKEQRVRLSQIDAPPLDSLDGKASFEYLRNTAAKLEEITVKTNKIDIYGRYLADIFYPASDKRGQTQADVFRTGVHLNAEMVRKGFAGVY